jgi:glycosyltransferase involved in cell wall biosynthesis
MKILKSSIISSFSLKREKFPKELQIECDDVNHITFKELIEIFTFIKGAKQVEWIDKNGNKKKANTLVKNFTILIIDLTLYLFILLKILFYINSFKKNKKLNLKPVNTNNILFLRTDHWFNIYSGGSVGHIKGVIDGLRKLGFKTHVVSSDYLYGVDKQKDFYLVSPNYNIGKNIPDLPEFIYNFQLINYLKNDIENIKPLFIYQRYSKGNFVGLLLKKKYNIPFICEYNGSLSWISKKWYNHKVFHEKLINKIEFLNLEFADLIVVVSDEMKEELLQKGIDNNKILINPNGVDIEIYTPFLNAKEIKDKYSLQNKNTIIGFIGTFGKWHGAEVLAEAFGILLNENPSLSEKVVLLLIGDGITMKEVKEKIKKYRIDNNVILTGQIPQSEGPKYLSICDILVSPHIPTPDGTQFFGSPTKLFEYMAMGKPIIASNLNQIGRILENEVTAILTKPGDPFSIKDAILKLINNKELCDFIAKNAREKVISEYTWEKNVSRVIEKFKEIIYNLQNKGIS